VDYSDINELADDVSDLQCDQVVKTEDGTDYDADDEDAGVKSDMQLMPPPPPLSGVVKDENTNTFEYETASGEGRRRKLDTPLAAMLPSKYQNIDVTEIFPDFRVDKVLHYEYVVVPYKYVVVPYMYVVVPYKYVVVPYMYVVVPYKYVVVPYKYVVVPYMYLVVPYKYVVPYMYVVVPYRYVVVLYRYVVVPYKYVVVPCI